MNASMVSCGRCRVALPLANADIAADGYRCLSCATDEKQAGRIAANQAEIVRMNALQKLRVSLFGGLLLMGLVYYGEGSTRWVAAVCLAGLAAFTVENVRRLLR